MLETWNKEYIHSTIEFSDDGSIVSIPGKTELITCITIYGDHVVKYDNNFEWKLTLIQDKKVTDSNFVVGLIPNKPELLNKYRNKYMWYQVRSYGGAYALGGLTGQFGHKGRAHSYSKENVFGKEGDILEMKFNWKESILSFKANGRDWGNALKTEVTKEKDVEFRLIVSILWAQDVKLMVEGYEC